LNHNIFAIELCMRLEPGSRLRQQLKDVVAKHPLDSTPGLKWEMLRTVSDKLAENAHLFERGCWDFFDDDGRALSDYEMWTNGMVTEEGARKEESGKPGQTDSRPRYMTFTVALLLKANTACARDLETLCDIPEDDLWRRETFVKILRGLRRVTFAAVKSDVLYLIPRDEGWGLTAEDLEHEKFEYLRKVTN
jgi:hypothetical protein